MNFRVILTALAVAALLGGAAAAPRGASTPVPATVAPLPPAQLEAYVDGIVDDAMRTDHISGVTVAIVQGGKPVLIKGYGAVSRRPWRAVTGDTPFRIGSVSKTFTWIALMREVEKGRVNLDNPVNAYLPRAARFPGGRFVHPILVWHLMAHSAGLEDLALGHLAPRPSGMLPLAQYVVREQPRRVREPGTVVSYCNYCAILAGDIVARLEGADFETVIERDITGPLGMTDTTFRDVRGPRPGLPAPMNPTLAASLSGGFEWADADFRPEPIEALGQVAPAGAGSSSARDMATYMIMLLRGGQLGPVRIFGPQTALAFRTPLVKEAPGINGWAHGFMQEPLPGGYTGYGHDGDTTLFHTAMTTVPALDLGVFISTNTDTGGKLVERFPALVVGHFYAPGADASPKAARVDRDALAPYAGAYITSRRAAGGVEGFLDLLQGDNVSVGQDGLVANGKLWVPDGEPGRFRQRDGVRVISFDLVNGRPVAWRSTFNTGLNMRAAWWQGIEPLGAAGGLTILAAIATLAGLAVRRRDLPRTAAQGAAGHVQTLAAIAWLVAIVGLAAWVANTSDSYALLAYWPGPFITAAVWAAALAALMSAGSLALLVPVCLGKAGWGSWRKARYAKTAIIFTALSLLVLVRGGLDIWSL